MKKSTITLVLSLLVTTLMQAQNCPKSQSFADLDINNVKARIIPGGHLFTDNTGSAGKLNYLPDPHAPTTVFDASLWIGGLDPAGNLKLSGSAYRTNYDDFAPGPLEYLTGTPFPNGCTNWDKVFSVTQTEIANFLTIGANLTTEEKIQQFPNVMGWPARGNAFFEQVNGFELPLTPQGMAPFIDKDGDGQYSPLYGDVPAVLLRYQSAFIPGQIIWCVMNDIDVSDPQAAGTQPMGMEVQLTAWAFDCEDIPVLQNTVFTSHKLLYRGSAKLDSFFVGMFTDFDLGCFSDDYVGCNPALKTQYCYNADAVDGSVGGDCPGMPNGTFVNSPPVQSVTFLDQPLDKFMSLGNNPPVTVPVTAPEYYNYLTGHWRDGTPLTQGGNGYNLTSSIPANYTYPDNPADATGWSMCSTGEQLVDRRVVGSVNIGELEPGSVRELTTAWSTTPNVPLPCGLGTVPDNVLQLLDIYQNNFHQCGDYLTPVRSVPAETLQLAPNPANSVVNIKLGATVARDIRVISADGRVLRTLHNLSGDQIIPVNDLANGWYLIQIVTEKGILNGKVAVQR